MERGPVRTCCGCRRRRRQSDLLRIARRPGGGVAVDSPEGRGPGRGAYVCPRRQCVERAVKTGALRRALRYEGELPVELRPTLLARVIGDGEPAARDEETKKVRKDDGEAQGASGR